MYSTSDFKKGLKILVEGEPYSITDFQHVKPGKGNQFTRTKLKHLLTSQNLERTFKSGEKFDVPNCETKDMNFLYKDEDGFHFMNPSDYEQLNLSPEVIGDNSNYLVEELQCTILFYNERAIGVDVPKAVNLKVTYCEPAVRGNTAQGVTKAATLQTGLVVQVPIHINEGDLLRIDSRNGEYVERVNK